MTETSASATAVGEATDGGQVLTDLTLSVADTGITGRLAEVAAALPDHPALDSGTDQLSYAQLVSRVRSLAAELRPALPRSADGSARMVAVLAEQTPDSVAAVLAVLAAGAPCAVLDVLLPEGRLQQIAEQAGIGLVLADQAHQEAARRLPGVDDVRGLLPHAEHDGADLPALPGDTPGIVVFTSGSTGLPKGVVWTHRTIVSSGVTARLVLDFAPTDRVSLIVPLSFGNGLSVMLSGVLNGATVCIRDPRLHGMRDLVEWLRTTRVTTLHCTPSLLRALHDALPADEMLETVRAVTTAGEPVFGDDVRAFRPHLGEAAQFANWLGASEVDMISSYSVGAADAVPDGVLPAGRVQPLREVEVLAADGSPAAPGEAGVLHVVSDSIAAGYWGDPAATASSFERLPDGRTRYRTSDRARLGADGVLHVLGRTDDAVKIRGYLVDPSEVEAALRALRDVDDVVVRARADAAGQQRLVAWVVPEESQRTPSPAGLRSRLASTLPDWMVPRDVVLLAALPRNERGKVDVAALPAPPPRPAPAPPTTATQRELEGIWAPVLRLDHVGPDESFTALGGDSLAVEEMLARLGLPLTSADLAEHPTLEQFALVVDAVRGGRQGERIEDLVRLRQTGTRAPMFCIAGAGADAAYFEPFAAAVGPDQPVYALQAHAFERRGLPDWTVPRAARRYVRIIEQVAPEGPVVLVGHSLGGLIALAAARLLGAQGRTVELVVVLDTFLPRAARRGEGGGIAEVPQVERLEGLARARMRLRVLGAGLWPYDPETQREVFHAQGARVSEFSRPQPWSGRALVFMSDDNRDDPAWWDRLLPGEHVVRRIPGDHHALLKQPFVLDVVDDIADALTGTTGGV